MVPIPNGPRNAGQQITNYRIIKHGVYIYIYMFMFMYMYLVILNLGTPIGAVNSPTLSERTNVPFVYFKLYLYLPDVYRTCILFSQYFFIVTVLHVKSRELTAGCSGRRLFLLVTMRSPARMGISTSISISLYI